MSFRKSLGKVLLLLVLEVGLVMGTPISPSQIEEMMQVMNRTHHEHVLRSEKDDGLDR